MNEQETAAFKQQHEANSAALNDIYEQGVDLNDPAQKEVWDQLVAEHQAEYDANKEDLGKLATKHIREANEDLQQRVEAGDHNAR